MALVEWAIVKNNNLVVLITTEKKMFMTITFRRLVKFEIIYASYTHEHHVMWSKMYLSKEKAIWKNFEAKSSKISLSQISKTQKKYENYR
jgi:hypothetical protein